MKVILLLGKERPSTFDECSNDVMDKILVYAYYYITSKISLI